MALYLGKNKVVKGNYKGSSGELDTSDATAVESNVIEGKTFYANGEKKVGTMGQWDGSSTSNSLSYSSGDIYIQSDGVSGGYIQAGASYRQKLTDPGSLGDAVASDVVKGKTFTSASGIKLEGTKEESEDIKLQEKTVSPSTSSQVITPDSGYGGLSKVNVNAMTTVSKATPSISVSSSGLITASATQPAGYVTSGTTSNTKQLSTQSGKTITPSTSQQVAVSSGVYTTDNIYVSGDTNLTSSNIKSGVSIFGVSGSYEGVGSTNGYHYSATSGSQSISFTIDDSDNFPTQIAVIAKSDSYESSGKTVIGALFEKADTGDGIPVGSWRSYTATKGLCLNSSGNITRYDTDATLSYDGSTATLKLSSYYFNSETYEIVMIY